MAVVVTALGTISSTTNPLTSLSGTTSAAISAGEKALISVEYPSDTPAPTATFGGNAMTLELNPSRAGAAELGMFRYDAVGTIGSGATVTITFSAGAGTGGVATMCKVAGIATGAPNTTGSSQGFSAAFSTGASGTPTAGSDYFAYAGLAIVNSGSTCTPAGTYTKLTAVDEAIRSNHVEAAWNTFTATVAAQTETWSTTFGSSNWAAGILLYAVTAGSAAAANAPRSFAAIPVQAQGRNL